MKVVTVRDFRDRASEMFRSQDVILVTRAEPQPASSCPGTRPSCRSRCAVKCSCASPSRSAPSSTTGVSASKRCSTISLPAAVVADANDGPGPRE